MDKDSLLPPAYSIATSTATINNNVIDPVMNTQDLFIRFFHDCDKDSLIFSYNNKYIYELKIEKPSIFNFNSCKLVLNNIEYIVNKKQYNLYLKKLGITNITDPVPLINLDKLTDKVWQHFSRKHSYKLLNDYHSAIARNDFSHAICLVQNGLPLDNYYTLTQDYKINIYLDFPTEEEICSFYVNNDYKDSHFDNVKITIHSPLTALLSLSGNELDSFQENNKTKLIQILKQLGCSTVKTKIDYELFVCVRDYGRTPCSVRIRKSKTTTVSMSIK